MNKNRDFVHHNIEKIISYTLLQLDNYICCLITEGWITGEIRTPDITIKKSSCQHKLHHSEMSESLQLVSSSTTGLPTIISYNER